MVVGLGGDRFTIELAPSPDARESSRGVVATGPVGARWAGRLRLFRYELRCWRGGTIPDLGDAVGGRCRLSEEAAVARRVLDLVAQVPTPVWGRDELHAGEGWNSNSVIAWLVATAGLLTDDVHPPLKGRAPGWEAGLEAARRDRDCGFSRIAPQQGSGPERVDAPDGRGVVRRQHAPRPHNNPQQGGVMSKFFKYGGIVASIVLIAFGVGAIYTGVDGRDRVQSDLAQEQIVGTPDSTIPGQKVDTGSEAQAFAATIRKHTLEATGGQTYAQMERFVDENGKPTNDENAAAKDPRSGEPVANQARNIWVTSTALQTALNTAYFAEGVATFAIVMGIAMLLSGIGFLILTLRVLREPTGEAKAAKPAASRPQAAATA